MHCDDLAAVQFLGSDQAAPKLDAVLAAQAECMAIIAGHNEWIGNTARAALKDCARLEHELALERAESARLRAIIASMGQT